MNNSNEIQNLIHDLQKVNVLPFEYDPEDMNTITDYYTNQFGESGFIMHEITSEYVHTDVMICDCDPDTVVLATFGMGAREMNAPSELDASRCELIAHCSGVTDEERSILLSELVALTKYPFRHDTWFWCGHTVIPSELFAKTFDCHAVMLFPCVTEKLSLTCGNISFYAIVPIYKDEYEKIVQHPNGSLEFMVRYFQELAETDLLFEVKKKRKHIAI